MSNVMQTPCDINNHTFCTVGCSCSCHDEVPVMRPRILSEKRRRHVVRGMWVSGSGRRPITPRSRRTP